MMQACSACGDPLDAKVKYYALELCYGCIDNLHRIKNTIYCSHCGSAVPAKKPSGRKTRTDNTMCFGSACRSAAARLRREEREAAQ
jgi:hypothetical protein